MSINLEVRRVPERKGLLRLEETTLRGRLSTRMLEAHQLRANVTALVKSSDYPQATGQASSGPVKIYDDLTISSTTGPRGIRFKLVSVLSY